MTTAPDNPNGAPPRPRAGRKEWLALAVLLLPVLLVSMDLTILYFALPAISEDLRPSGDQQLWLADIYGFVLAGVLITMGALGDRIGRRRLLLVGAVVFGLGSLAAAYAGNPETVIVARALQGLGGATLMPSTLALIRNIFHDQTQRRTAVAVWSTGMAVGAALGPVVSGALLNWFWWGSVFVINVPVMLLLLAVGPVLLPEFRTPSAARFDVLSAVVSLAAVLPVIYGFKKIAVDGVGLVPVVAVVVGLAFVPVFVRRQQTVTDPMIDVGLLRGRSIGPAVTANVLASFILVGYSLFSTQYLQSVLGMSALKAALWTLPGTVAVGMAVPLATVLVRTVKPAYIIATGFTIAGLALLMLTRAPAEDGLAVMIVGIIAVAVGVTPVLTLVTELVVGQAPPERAGSASALLQTGQEFGGALGIAALGALGAAVYRNSPALDAPAGVPPEALEPARETIGGALSAAGTLPEPASGHLVDAAREAFTSEVHGASWAGAAVMAVAAVFSLYALRSVGSDRERASAADTQPEAARKAAPEAA
ncbi:Antiseptic resistance protein [Streptomyces sp. RB5]|uniref:Antiseptic resistance protein n=1 Tax=Streptomyces smaragdinus TaxID=2585196 RepID=A0A7K0CKR9_9ACTN|nr:MFS transporter [Streptomyces smaragdinus]MQY14086.1 Antiseptic resistance protein [Streptomyces smaragdinus]